MNDRSPLMSVYVLSRFGDHEAGWVLGVFSSLEGAMKTGDETMDGEWTAYEPNKDNPRPSWARGQWEGQDIELWTVDAK